jgi:phosphatidylglycerol:prolipoprotein diacylglycerol transferase
LIRFERWYYASRVAPVFAHLSLSPVGFLGLLFAITVALTAYLVIDGRRRPKEKRRFLWLQATVLFLIGSAVSLVLPAFLTGRGSVELDLRSWGLLAVMGMLSALIVQRTVAIQHGIDPERVFDAWLFGGLAALAGARILHVAVNWSDYAAQPLAAVWLFDGGLVWLGAFLGYAAFVAGYSAWHKLGASFFDALAVGLPIGHGVSRIGCFLAGCCWGRPTELFGVRFGPGSIAFEALLRDGRLLPGATSTLALHPTQLYEAAFELSLGVFLFLRSRSEAWRARPGALACIYIFAYSGARFLLEMLRDDPDRSFLMRIPDGAPLVLSTSQVLSIALSLLGLWGWKRLEPRDRIQLAATL